MSTNISDYQIMINNVAGSNSKDMIPFFGKEQSAIVMAKLFEKAQKEVCMVVGSFSGEISNEPSYLESMKNAIERKVAFRIIFLNEINEKSEAFNLLEKMKNCSFNIEIREADPSLNNNFHFATADGCMFRLEKDTTHFSGWASFNDEKNTSILQNIFESAFERAHAEID